MEAVMKQKNLTSDDAINRKLWRLKSSKRGTTGKLIGVHWNLMLFLIMCYWEEIRVINTAYKKLYEHFSFVVRFYEIERLVKLRI